jgi:hypothetical protein
MYRRQHLNPLNTELNPICHLLPLLGARHILHVSGQWVKKLASKFRTAAVKILTQNKVRVQFCKKKGVLAYDWSIHMQIVGTTFWSFLV